MEKNNCQATSLGAHFSNKMTPCHTGNVYRSILDETFRWKVVNTTMIKRTWDVGKKSGNIRNGRSAQHRQFSWQEAWGDEVNIWVPDAPNVWRMDFSSILLTITRRTIELESCWKPQNIRLCWYLRLRKIFGGFGLEDAWWVTYCSKWE